MQFDRNKIELIHFHLKKSLNLKNEKYLIKIKKAIFQLKKLIKYLNV